MKLDFKRVIAFLCVLIFILTFSACKDKESTDVSSEPVSKQEIVAIPGDDTQDPENTDNGEQIGEKVEVEHLVTQTGKANGIDVSKWQGLINWKNVKNSGIDFAIIRIGYRGEDGAIYKDVNADYNIQQAQKAGVLVGVYFFSTAVNTAEALEEANWTLSAIKGYSISYPVVYDCEGFSDADSRMYNLTKSVRTDNALTFLSVIEKAGYDAMFYASKNDLVNYWEISEIASVYKILIAQYTTPA